MYSVIASHAANAPKFASCYWERGKLGWSCGYFVDPTIFTLKNYLNVVKKILNNLVQFCLVRPAPDPEH